jgi:hypothetical protein
MPECRGFFIPQYRSAKQTESNPFYLSDKVDNLTSINTTDEFVSIAVHKEVESICADCKHAQCRGSYVVEKKQESSESSRT